MCCNAIRCSSVATLPPLLLGACVVLYTGDVHVIEEEILQFYRVGAAGAAAQQQQQQEQHVERH